MTPKIEPKVEIKTENLKKKRNEKKFIEDKPYTILNYPFVIMNGKMYEIMSREDIKEELRCHFLKKKRRKKRKPKNAYNYF